MDQLQQQVARARRRLIIEQFAGRFVRCLLWALSLATLAIAAPRVVAINGLPAQWDMAWLGGSILAALVVTAAWTFISNRSPLDAAIEIDRRFDLRERIASSLSLSPEQQGSDAGRAVINDAMRAVQRIEVDDKFRVKLDRRAWWPLVPAAIVFVLVAFFDNREASSSVDREAALKAEQQTKNALESLRKKMEEQRKKLTDAKDLKGADDLFKQIEEGTKELSQKDKVDPTKAHVKLNELTKQLEERRQKAGGQEAIKEQLQKMKDLGAGPADKVAQAMKQGDWQKAMSEIDKLAKDLREGKLDKESKEKLEKQLEKMQQKLEAAAEAHQKAIADLKKQIEDAKRNGDMAKAGQLQQKLDQMQKKQAQVDRMQQLAKQLANAQQAMKQGDGKKAANAMQQMAQQLAQMKKEQDELKTLDAMMNEMEMAKDAMVCKKCNGEGCEECQGNMFARNEMENPNGKPGRGMGRGVGIGARPEERNSTNTRDTQVRQKTGKGAATFGGLVEGPNIKGDVAQSIKEEMKTKAAEPADPLTNDRLSRSRQEQATQYFEMLREGK
jgi:hypothetical protein